MNSGFIPISVLFLDIDGVLNSQKSISSRRDAGGNWNNDAPDQEYLDRLDRIITETDAYIVISSTWRKSMPSFTMGLLLHKCGLSRHASRRIICSTPELGGSRGVEILSWLIHRNVSASEFSPNIRERYKVTKMCILDDDDDVSMFGDYLILTNFLEGLTEGITDKVIEFLNSDDSKIDEISFNLSTVSKFPKRVTE